MTASSVESTQFRRAAWGVWIALTLVVCYAAVAGKERSVTPSYRGAVENWFAGEPIYNMAGSNFIYFPQAALVFAPWGLLPIPVGEILWRATILGVLAAGVYRFTRLASVDDRWFLINTFASAGTAAGCARNGQSTLIVTGLMLLAIVDLHDRRWWRATLLLSLAFAFKPIAIVLILLVAAIYLQMLWRLTIGLLLVAVLPFLTQTPDYVISQYQACYENSHTAFQVGITGHWAQLFGMLKVVGLEVPSPVQQVIRIVVAGATLVICWGAVRRLSPARGLFFLYAFATSYLMLFNSRTEGSTYAMIGPVYGLLLAEAWLIQRSQIGTTGYLLAVIGTVFNFDLALLVVKRPDEIWLCPFICVIVTIDLIRRLVREIRGVHVTPRTMELS
jgi:hypothetical protein